MNIIVIHGDDIRQNYARLKTILNQAKSRGLRVEKIIPDEGKNLSESFVSGSIFNENLLYLVENPSQIPVGQLKWLKSNVKNLEGDLIIYSQKPLGKSFINILPLEAKIEEFRLPVYIWKFLDSFYPGNSRNCLGFFKKAIETENPERVFSLLAGHLKNLLMVGLDKKSLQFPSWRLNKLILQASKFGERKLENIISEMAKIDVEVKTSSTNLSDSLDFMIVTQLE